MTPKGIPQKLKTVELQGNIRLHIGLKKTKATLSRAKLQALKKINAERIRAKHGGLSDGELDKIIKKNAQELCGE